MKIESVLDGNLIGLDSLLAGSCLTLLFMCFTLLGEAYENGLWISFHSLYDLGWGFLIVFIVFTLCAIVPTIILLIVINRVGTKSKNYFSPSYLGAIIFAFYSALLLFFRGITDLEICLIWLADWAITGFLIAVLVKCQVEQLAMVRPTMSNDLLDAMNKLVDSQQALTKSIQDNTQSNRECHRSKTAGIDSKQ